MNLLLETASSVLRGLLKVALIAVSAVFVLGVLCIGLLFAAAMAVRFMVTGRKPAMVATFTQFQHAAQRFRPGSHRGPGATAPSGHVDVVDVQAREVHPVRGIPSTGASPD